MSKKNTMYSLIFVFISAALMVVTLLLQFAPFWTEGSQTVSINGFVYFPLEHNELQASFADIMGSTLNLNAFVWPLILQTALAIVGIVVCLWKPDKFVVSLLPILCGGVGIGAYLTNPALQLGTGWILHLAVGILTLLVGFAALLIGIAEQKTN